MLTLSKDGFGSEYDDLDSERFPQLPPPALVHTFTPKKLQADPGCDGETPDTTLNIWPFGSSVKGQFQIYGHSSCFRESQGSNK